MGGQRLRALLRGFLLLGGRAGDLLGHQRLFTGGVAVFTLASLFTGALTVLVYALVNAGAWGWGSGRVIGLLYGAAALFAVFLVIESRTSTPLVRLGIFRLRSLSAGNATMFLMMAGIYTLLFFPVLYLGEIKDYSALGTGLAILPWPFTMLVRPAADGGGAGFAWQLLFLVATAKVRPEESGRRVRARELRPAGRRRRRACGPRRSGGIAQAQPRPRPGRAARRRPARPRRR